MIGHESEIAEPGDYITATVVGSEILVTRDEDGEVRGFYNVCRHRGALLAMENRGQASFFRCPYHFWCYSLKGNLTSIPGEEAYEETGFEKARTGLVPVRVESAHGVLFVNISGDAPTLREWLGGAFEIMAKPLAGADMDVFHRQELPIEANWKV